MATQKIKVDLLFNANTQQAQAELKKLSDSLQKVQNRPGAITDAFGFDRAAESARLLEKNLKAAVDVNTGKLNLSKFTQGLKHSNQSLENIYNNLKYFGIEGEQIFNSLAKSISLSDASMLKVNDKLKEMIKTLGNTMRWEISSKVLRGFESALNNAYGYAQDLNKSLNDIRIVTGYNTDQMAKFAKEANKAAKALSTTTTDYTKASLIYYQQGLTDKEVQERTNATVKMANVTGTAAEEVSSQLTAVWNNFADGSKNLEYYADVMTALGAATASSSDEISQGLNKFAATAQTVGLSYEYAASALATVTAATRESADVVGTAFKTLFARIQDLELGETLDDGTTLGSYSQALAKVGIDIKDTNDEIKTMDTLLTEIAGKWQTMSKDAQIALAESVAGTRQYTQLMALMNNWGSFQENLQVSYSSSGTLDEQAEIYAESWEAAEKRVTASAEEMYSKIINDEAFIKLTNGFAKLIDFTSDVVDGFGGVAGVMATIGSIVMNKYAKEMPQFFENLAANIRALTGAADQDKIKQLSAINNFLEKSHTKEAEALQLLNKKQIEIIQNKKYYSEVQLKEYQQRINNIAAIADETAAYEKSARKLQINADLNERILKYKIKSSKNKKQQQYETDLQTNYEKLIEVQTKIKETPAGDTKVRKELEKQQKIYQDNIYKISEDLGDIRAFDENEIEGQIENLKKLAKQLTEAEYYLQDFRQAGENAFSIGEDFGSTEQEKIEKIRQNLELFSKKEIFSKAVTEEGQKNFKQFLEDIEKSTDMTLEDLSDRFKAWADNAVQINTKDIGYLEDEIEKIVSELSDKGNLNPDALEEFIAKIRESEGESIKAELAIKKLREEANRKIESNSFEIMIEGFGKITSGAMAGVAAVTSIVNAVERLQDPDLSGWEKFTIIASVLTSVIANVKTLSQTLDINTVTKTINAAATWLLAKANKANADAIDESADNTKEDTKEQAKNAVVKTLKAQYNKSGKNKGAEYFVDGKKTDWNEFNSLLGDKRDQFDNWKNLSKTQKGQQPFTIDIPQSLPQGGTKTPSSGFKELGVAIKGLGTSLISFLAPALPYIAAIGAAVAVITTVTVLAIQQANKYEKALKEATETAIQLKEAYDQANSAYQELAGTISSYQDLTNNMKELTEGTAEYTEALLKANDAALELIKNNPKLQYTVENGVITITDDNLESYKKEEALRLAKLNSSKLASEYNVTKAQMDLDTANLAKDIYSREDFAAILGNGLVTGSAIGSIITAIEGSSAEKDNLEELYQAIKESGDSISMFANEIAFEDWINSNDNLSEETKKMVDALGKNTEAIKQWYIERSSDEAVSKAEWIAAFLASQNENESLKNANASTYFGEVAYGNVDAYTQAGAEEVATRREGTDQDFWKEYMINVLGENEVDIETDGSSLIGKNYKLSGTRGGRVRIFTKDENGDWKKEDKRLKVNASKDALANSLGIEKAGSDIETNLASLKRWQEKIGIDSEDQWNSLTDEERLTYETIFARLDLQEKINFDAINKYAASDIANKLKDNDSFMKQYRASGIGDDAYVKYYQNLVEADKKIFLQLDVDKVTSEQNIDQGYQALKSDFENETFYVKIGFAKDALASLEENDFNTLKINLQDNFGYTEDQWLSFLSKTREEQQAELANLYSTNVQGFASDENSNIEQNIKYLEELKEATATEDKEKIAEINKELEAAYIRRSESYELLNKTVSLLDSTIERYKEINDQLKLSNNKLSVLQKHLDKTFGASRIKQIQEINKSLKETNELIDIKIQENSNYLLEDKASIEKAFETFAGVNGISNFVFDSATGMITNYTQVMRDIEQFVSNNNIEVYTEAFKDLEKAIKSYNDELQISIDLENEKIDNINTILTNNYDSLSYKIELKLELNQMDLSLIESKMNIIKDDFYEMAEAAALLGGREQSSISETEKQYNILKNATENLTEAYNKGLIGQSDYTAGLKRQYDNTLNTIQALTDLDKQMLEYYGNAISKANELLGEYNARLEYTTAILDHYKNIMTTLGKETDYKNMGIILEGQSQTIKNEMEVAKKTYEMYAAEAQKKERLYLSETNEEAKKLYEQEWKAAEQAMREAQDNMLSKTAEWAEAIKATIENELAGLGETLEKSLTGGMSFDELGTSMERAASLQEDYLTSTNKIYETTKLMRTAQNAMDATTNSVAKQKLQNYINETKALQSSTKLSKYELDIQQAKYDLLLAEIALQDAQNAKTKVRLTRDAEGNFGYVYTADQNKVNEAQQKFEDAQNKLYNIGLDGANEYVEKYQQTMQQMYDELTSLQTAYLNGEITTQEEYNRRQNEIQAFYYQKLKDYSSLYQVALTTDSRVVADAWSTDFADMTYRTDEWMSSVTDYVNQTEEKFIEWQNVIDEVEKNVDVDFTNMENAVKDVTTESTTLADTINNKVIPAIGNELNEISKITGSYAGWRSEIQSTIDLLLALAEAQKNAYQEQAGNLDDNGIEDLEDPLTISQAYTQMVNYASWLQQLDGNNSLYGSRWVEDSSGRRIISGTLKDYISKYRELAGSEANEEKISKIIQKEEQLINGESIESEGPVTGNEGQGSGNQKTPEEETDSLAKKMAKADVEDGIGMSEAIPFEVDENLKEYYLSRYKYWYNLLKPKGQGIGGSGSSVLLTTFLNDGGVRFASGGYTGAWGPEGKLAILDEKELILNQDDTANFLASLDLLHDIIGMIDLQAANAQTGSGLSIPQFNYSSGSLEQSVHIEASFPGVTDRTEIEEAFNNLVNKASQYANRK